ncbi:MAG: hypothetical protein H6905_11475, partial [Hyphomicrobiales bacterium]|nr:hypothetical protein [Hyphomicrobiales bacterium]
TVAEPSDYPNAEATDYSGIRAAFIEPIEKSWQLCLRIGEAIANEFGAHG